MGGGTIRYRASLAELVGVHTGWGNRLGEARRLGGGVSGHDSQQRRRAWCAWSTGHLRQRRSSPRVWVECQSRPHHPHPPAAGSTCYDMDFLRRGQRVAGAAPHCAAQRACGPPGAGCARAESRGGKWTITQRTPASVAGRDCRCCGSWRPRHDSEVCGCLWVATANALCHRPG